MKFLEILEWIFGSFWRFAGVCAILILIIDLIKLFFDFIVELIHGKQTIQNFNLPENTKIEEKKEINKVSSGASVSNADVFVKNH